MSKRESRLEERFLLMAKEIIALVYSNISFPAFQTKLSKELNSFGTDLCGNLPVLDTKFSLTRQAIRGLSNGYYKLI